MLLIRNKNRHNIAVIAFAIIIIGGLVAIPTFTNVHDAQAVFPKVKYIVKKIVKNLFDRHSDDNGDGGTGDCKIFG